MLSGKKAQKFKIGLQEKRFLFKNDRVNENDICLQRTQDIAERKQELVENYFEAQAEYQKRKEPD